MLNYYIDFYYYYILVHVSETLRSVANKCHSFCICYLFQIHVIQFVFRCIFDNANSIKRRDQMYGVLAEWRQRFISYKLETALFKSKMALLTVLDFTKVSFCVTPPSKQAMYTCIYNLGMTLSNAKLLHVLHLIV